MNSGIGAAARRNGDGSVPMQRFLRDRRVTTPPRVVLWISIDTTRRARMWFSTDTFVVPRPRAALDDLSRAFAEAAADPHRI